MLNTTGSRDMLNNMVTDSRDMLNTSGESACGAGGGVLDGSVSELESSGGCLDVSGSVELNLQTSWNSSKDKTGDLTAAEDEDMAEEDETRQDIHASR